MNYNRSCLIQNIWHTWKHWAKSLRIVLYSLCLLAAPQQSVAAEDTPVITIYIDDYFIYSTILSVSENITRSSQIPISLSMIVDYPSFIEELQFGEPGDVIITKNYSLIQILERYGILHGNSITKIMQDAILARSPIKNQKTKKRSDKKNLETIASLLKKLRAPSYSENASCNLIKSVNTLPKTIRKSMIRRCNMPKVEKKYPSTHSEIDYYIAQIVSINSEAANTVINQILKSPSSNNMLIEDGFHATFAPELNTTSN